MVLQKSQSNDKLKKKECLPVITQSKKHSSKQVVSITYTLEKRVFAAATLRVCRGIVSFLKSKRTSSLLSSFWVLFAFLQVRRENKLLGKGKFSFLYVDICFDLTKCKFTVKNSSFKMLVMLSPICIADTKIALFIISQLL